MRAVAAVVGLAVVALVVYVVTRPDRFHVERSVTIAAPSATIFPYIDDFHRWTSWSPWETIDPQLKRTYEGPAAGLGAGYRWAGNNDVGQGSMKIVESTPTSRVGIALEFEKPFKASNTATFTLVPDGAGTRVTWAMDGANTVISKVIGLFVSMDTMIGTQFDKGLAALKGIAERRPPQ